ncbi:Shikimate kinase III [Klebsiella aerogenes]|nr:Shikimate kinase III [Klebsiella aerogenes]
MTQPIFLIGPRGCGKPPSVMRWRERGIFSSPIPIIGCRAHEQRTVAEIVQAEGWARFRELETLSLKAVTLPNTVIATGGGIVLAEGNRQFMRENGVVIYLQASVSALIDRLEAYPKAEQRPTLTGKPVREEVGEVLAQREALYRDAAHHIVDATASPDRVVEQIMTMLCGATATPVS